MKLIIDMPEEKYDVIKNNYNTFPAEMKEWGLGAIKNGTPLPKGHGRIMDVDEVIKKMEEREEQLKDDRSMYEASCVETAIDMFGETIIKADAKSEGKE